MNSDSVQSTGRKITFLRALGKGGFGSVHLAEVRSGEGLVHRMAVKVLHEDLSSDKELAARARDEARLMSQLNHDNIVRIYGLTRIAGRSAVLMEYVEGIDCVRLINKARSEGGGVPFRAAARIMECAADALWTAYRAVSPQTKQQLRVVHRDIKPGNILVSTSGTTKVMDFGVARADFEREAETQSLMFGTQRYMAPERWLEGECGHASDIFSLGVTFWELVTGEKFAQVPFAPGHFERRIEENVLRFVECIPLVGRERETAVALLRGMLAYRAIDRLDGKRVREVLSDLSELSSGPSLRRYARRVVPELVEIQQAVLLGDRELREFTGTLNTASSASGEMLRVPSSPGASPELDPRLAATIFEAQELPERAFGATTDVVKPVADPQLPIEAISGPGARRPTKPATVVVISLSGLVTLFLIAWLLKASGEERTESGLEFEASALLAEEVVSPEIAVQGSQDESASVAPSVGGAAGAQESVSPARSSKSASSRAAQPSIPAIETVRIKILADPREGQVQVGEQSAAVSESLELALGEHLFEFEGSDWTANCRESVDAGVKKIKFVKETGLCVLLR